MGTTRSPGAERAVRIALLTLAIGMAACQARPMPVAELLADGTRSAATPGMRAAVEQALNSLAECGATRGVHLIVALTSNSPAANRLVYSGEISPEGENPETQRRNAPDIVERVTQEVTPSITEAMDAPVEGTTAFDALVAAGADLGQFESSSRTLVWISDGIEWHESADGQTRWNLARADLSATGIEALLGSLREQGLVADLRGVDVYAAGIGLAPGIDSATAGRLRAFWRSYMLDAGATLRFIGPRLVALPCP